MGYSYIVKGQQSQQSEGTDKLPDCVLYITASSPARTVWSSDPHDATGYTASEAVTIADQVNEPGYRVAWVEHVNGQVYYCPGDCAAPDDDYAAIDQDAEDELEATQAAIADALGLIGLLMLDADPNPCRVALALGRRITERAALRSVQ